MPESLSSCLKPGQTKSRICHTQVISVVIIAGLSPFFEAKNLCSIPKHPQFSLFNYCFSRIPHPQTPIWVSFSTPANYCLASRFSFSHRRGGYQPPARYKLTIISQVGRIRTSLPSGNIQPAAQKSLPGGRLRAAPTVTCPTKNRERYRAESGATNNASLGSALSAGIARKQQFVGKRFI